jgi:hypothetical protein
MNKVTTIFVFVDKSTGWQRNKADEAVTNIDTGERSAD